jgi:hypothetical protein
MIRAVSPGLPWRTGTVNLSYGGGTLGQWPLSSTDGAADQRMLVARHLVVMFRTSCCLPSDAREHQRQRFLPSERASDLTNEVRLQISKIGESVR